MTNPSLPAPIFSDPSFLAVYDRLPRLEQSIYAYRWAPPDVDTIAIGAAVYYNIPLDQVTTDLRGRWKHKALPQLAGLSLRIGELTLARSMLRELATGTDKARGCDTLRLIVNRNQNEGVLTEGEWTALRDVIAQAEAWLTAHAAAAEVFG